MPIEVRRFGVGHRRPDGPSGTVGIEGQVIVSGATGVIAELAFGRRAHIVPHANPNPTWFLVIEGGGFVRSGEVRARVAAGEAVLWEPGEVHAAWTELSEMRVIVVDFGTADPATIAGLLEGRAREIPTDADGADAASRAEGTLQTGRTSAYDPAEGEPA